MFLNNNKQTSEFMCKSKKGKIFIRKCTKTIHNFMCDTCKNKFARDKGTILADRLNKEVKHFCENCIDYSVVGSLGHDSIRENLEKKIGDKRIDSYGYVQVYVGPPSSQKTISSGYYGGSIREHTMVMEKHLNRSLVKGEVVHHIDGDKANNDLNNLQVMTVKEHNNCHAKNDALIMKLFKEGIINYSRENKQYFLSG
jgi:hypothetical protein